MSSSWVMDIGEMHKKYEVHQWMKKNPDLYDAFIEFRLKFLQEELDETRAGWMNVDPEEIVDGLIDLCVVAIGTLDAFGVNTEEAWDRVLEANMDKEVGVKEERPNPLGMPDLVKPDDWKAPNHLDNHGKLKKWQEIMIGGTV